MLHDWIYLEDNTWLRELLPDELFTLLEFDTKISQGKFTELSTPARGSDTVTPLDFIMMLDLL